MRFGEVHVFVGKDFVVTVRHGEAPDLHGVRMRMDMDLLCRGPEAILCTIMDRVVDDYAPVVAGLEKYIDEIQTEVFGGNAGVSRRTHELSREVIEFQRAVKPLTGILNGLMDGLEKYGIDPELQRYRTAAKGFPRRHRLSNSVNEEQGFRFGAPKGLGSTLQ